MPTFEELSKAGVTWYVLYSTVGSRPHVGNGDFVMLAIDNQMDPDRLTIERFVPLGRVKPRLFAARGSRCRVCSTPLFAFNTQRQRLGHGADERALTSGGSNMPEVHGMMDGDITASIYQQI